MDWSSQPEGADVIAKVLVANRGEIARRVFRTCRSMGLATAAVFSDVDADSPFVREADEAVRLPGRASVDTYLNVELILAAARHVRADAIHPGYGFLSENAEFAEACQAAGLTFVGPPPPAIRIMGSKLEAKLQMESAGVPVLPSADVAVVADAALVAEGARIGYPLIVKASYGGGGKGMRLVTSAADLEQAVASARREAAAAFGNDGIFLERYLSMARHVEIQIFADHHGDVVSLFERECSIQRRHQKIVEEAPSVALTEELRAEMGAAAIAAAKAVAYVGAGTVEFMLAGDGTFYFLEMNTRLQVEHPVTEAITGLDLVRLQLEIADGSPLGSAAHGARINGHAIEVRLYAEDPQRDFLPVPGRLHRFEVPTGHGIRLDSGVESGSEVSLYYDPMLAKVIAHGPSRDEAARILAAALVASRIHGLKTNRDLLVRLLRHPDFLAGETDTGFLDRHSIDELAAPLVSHVGSRIHALGVALALQAARRARATVGGDLPSGWRNVKSQMHWVDLENGLDTMRVEYRIEHDLIHATVDGEVIGGVTLRSCTATFVDLEIECHRIVMRVEQVNDEVFVTSPFGPDRFREVSRFSSAATDVAPGSLIAPMPATVVRVAATVGASVQAGDALVVLEAMKMEHTIGAPVAGKVTEVLVELHSLVDAGDLLLVVQGEEGGA
jgi:acetyl/propionyl-CoA carboxylase alpha subunit